VEIALLVIAIVGLVPVGYFIYTTYIRKPHSIDLEIGNVALVRVASPNKNRDGKLALIIYSLAFVNRGPTSLTLKKVALAYRFEGQERHAELTDVPIGTVDGVEAIALANTKDKIMIAWTNLRGTLSQNIPLQPGAVLSGSAVFLLDVPISRLRDISDYSLLVRDYSGGRSAHKLTPEDRWYQAHEKNFSLMDAPVMKTGDQIHWQGITLTSQKPA
jgi:hypothetical protein